MHATLRLTLLTFSALTLSALPALAQSDQTGLNLGLAGAFNGYMVYHTQGTTAGNEERNFDLLREAVIDMEAETTLDNGLTVGYFLETTVDMGESFRINDSYMYVSGDWGLVNFGGTDGAASLLQVAAPAADPLIDGIEQYINPVNYQAMLGLGAAVDVPLHYLMAQSGADDKLTYLTPSLNGLQAGVSYTPEVNDETSRGLAGVLADDTEEDFGSG